MKKEKKVNIRENLKIYSKFLLKYKFMFFIIIFIVFIQEGRGILDKYLIKVMFDKATDFSSGLILKSEALSISMLLLVFLFLSLIFIGVILGWLIEHLVIKLEMNMVYNLKEKYFSHIVSLDHNFFTKHKTGSLISKMTRGGTATERVTDSIFYEFAPFFFQSSLLLVSLLYLNVTSAIIISIIVISFMIFNISFQRVSNRDKLLANKAEDIEKANIADIFTNIDSIKYFGKEYWIKNKYLNLANDTKISMAKGYNHYRNIRAGNSFILGIGTISLLFFSIRSLLSGDITIGTLSFIYTTYISLIGPMFGFMHGFRNFNRSMTDFDDLFEYGRVESKIVDKPKAGKIKIEKGEIEFDSVDFSYDKRKILKDFSLKIPASKKIALVGSSGSGKTTLVKLLYRFYDINSGSITIDGKDIREVKQESLREEMSIVPQECILFDDTIYNNIKFSNPSATRREVDRAIKFAQLDKIISRFSEKENTIVGERGIKLSGGEKQRVSIARAILANKKILVLDEATSALDSETEYEIQLALKKLMEKRTSIVIAHRLSTIMNADTIVVMKDGRIVQMGKHNDLIRRDGEYKKLWNLQKGGYLK